MTPNPEPPPGRLPHMGVLRFSGADALPFLQGQLSNDTRRLAAKAPLFAAYLNPQGRVLALMHLLPHEGTVAAILPRELVLPTLESLRKFVLRAKVKLEDASDALHVVGMHGDDGLSSAGLPAPARGEYVERDGVGVASVDKGAARYWLLGAAPSLAAFGSVPSLAGLGGVEDPSARAEQAWRLADVHAGLPQIYAATREAFVAQMLNLDRLDAISFSKGCYTGQEIVARTQHLGRIKRTLHRLRLPAGQWERGQPLRLGDGRSGRIVEVVPDEDHHEALAVLNLQSDAGEPHAVDAQAVAAVELPLPYT